MPPSALCLLATSPASHPAEPVVMTHSSQPALSASSEPAAAPLQQHRCRSSRRWSTTSRPTPRSAGHLQLGGSFRQPRAGRDSDGRALLVLAGGLLAHRVLPASPSLQQCERQPATELDSQLEEPATARRRAHGWAGRCHSSSLIGLALCRKLLGGPRPAARRRSSSSRRPTRPPRGASTAHTTARGRGLRH